MERIEDNDVKMLGATKECLTKNATSYTGNLIIKDISDDIDVSLVYIQEQHLIQLNGSADATTVKNEDRVLAETSVFKVKSGEIAYFNSVKDHSSFNFINKSNSDIKAMDDNTFVAYANNVHATAVELGVKLVPFNILTTDVTLLKTRIDKLADELAKTRSAITAITVATANINKELHRIKGRLENELDPLVDTFIDTAPDFVNEYHASRKIVHYGVRHKTAEATINFMVISATDETPLRLVKITVLDTTDKALTDDAGAAIVKLEKAGVYTITYEKFGYDLLTQTGVELAVGDVLALTIKLVPIVIVKNVTPE